MEPTLADYRRLAEFRYQIRRFLAFSERAARATGLEPQHHQLLLAARGMPEDQEPTIGALAARLQLRQQSVVELVDRLVERGLVERLRSEQDRRRVLVRLTPEGNAVLQRLSAHHLAQLRSSGPLLIEALRAILGPDDRVSGR